ncbi:hypothetical protein EVAR_87499_1 [Eumeta japonica]|uniref:Uncharacterized protein n=1 Tax=Eumeta variegata TaxID=151549 RepID=A0A4C1VZ37_EUMVA|nr:hypothetical protein EVAR_87499_1 [Eumeta japonica]
MAVGILGATPSELFKLIISLMHYNNDITNIYALDSLSRLGTKELSRPLRRGPARAAGYYVICGDGPISENLKAPAGDEVELSVGTPKSFSTVTAVSGSGGSPLRPDRRNSTVRKNYEDHSLAGVTSPSGLSIIRPCRSE